MLRLTVRLLKGGGLATAVRLVAMAFGVALVVLGACGAWAVPRALSGAATRIAARQPLAVERPTAHSFLFQELDDTVGTRELSRVLVASGDRKPIRASDWAPHGCPVLPTPGSSCVSPALARAVHRDALLAKRLSLGPTVTIGESGLSGPNEYLVYQGVRAGQLTDPQWADGWTGGAGASTGVSRLEVMAEVGLLVGLPGLLFLVVSASLSAATRVSRTRALRLLGMTRGQLRFIAAAEGRIAGLLGGLAGLSAYHLLATPFARSNLVGFTWFARDTQINVIAAVVVLVLVTLSTGALTIWSTGRQLETPLRRTVAPARLWRLIPVWASVLTLSVLIAIHHSKPHMHGLVKVFIVAAVVGVAGLVVALRPLTESIAGSIGALDERVSLRLATRRLRVDSAATCRILTAAVGVIVVAAISAAVLQAANLAAGKSNSEQTAAVPAFEVSSVSASTIRSLPARAVGINTTTPQLLAAGVAPSANPAVAAVQLGVSVVYGTCASVSRFDDLTTPCANGQVYRVADDDPAYFANVLPVGMVIGQAGHRIRIPQQIIRVHDLTSGLLGVNSILVTSLPDKLPSGSQYEFLLPSANAAITRFQDALGAAAIAASAQFETRDLDALRVFQIHNGIISTGSVVGFILCALAFVIAVADRARERRRNVATLVAIGTSHRTIRLSQIIEVLIPAVVAAVCAVLLGVLIGTTYLNLDGTLQHGFFDGTLTAAAPLAVAAIVISGLSGSIIGWRRVRPSQFRRE